MALTNKLTAIGDAIREKTGKNALLSLDQMPVEIRAIETGGGSGGEGGDSSAFEDMYFSSVSSTNMGDYINDRITYVRRYAFAGSAFQNYILPNVERLEDYAFYCLGSLPYSDIRGTERRFSLPKITEIPNYCFYFIKEDTFDEAKLVFDIPNVVKIGEYGFQWCEIRDFTHNKITQIGQYSFANCQELSSIDLPVLITAGNYAFQDCEKLVSINLPNLENGGISLFEECAKIEEITLPKLTTLERGMFASCDNLKKIDLGENCNSINITTTLSSASPFYYDTALEALILRSKTLIANPNNNVIHSGCSIKKGTGYIYVPAALVEEYKVAANWSVCASQFRAIEDYPEICGEA